MGLERDDLNTYFFFGLVLVFGVLSYMLVAPYVYYVIGAAILVYISYPLYRELRDLLGNETVSSLLSIIVLIVVAVAPMIYLADQVVAQGQQALRDVGTQATAYLDTASLESTFHRLTGEKVDIDRAVRRSFVEAGNLFSARLPGIISTALDAMVGLFVTAFTMYYLFKDGDTMLESVKGMVPLEEDREDHLVEEIDRMSKAILYGHVLVSVVQGIIAGIGLWIFGIPDVIFWTFVMIVLGLIPLIGNFLVWGPAGLYLIFIRSEPLMGAGLLLYSTVILSFTDNIVRAKVVGERGNIHPLVVMVGVIGGIPMFGLLGVVLGPLVLGFFTSLLRVYREDFLQN
ncbi:MAG: AI-2E family transporter [Candidatus Nanohaloarchaea archaeon]|nr:AI-2E family transporter [Candidatus Nanohaloarchaea archaeon]